MKINYKYILEYNVLQIMKSGAAILRINEKTQDYDYVAISEERLIRKNTIMIFHCILFNIV